ncbi:TonB-dependent receptor [Pedobacter alpinus]|uniref:TonB-dependent receptor n=1 Tax=Pedobacter alpinus TaxID=1590643 RepID=A0ABW5TVH1_9SPHI
MNKRTYISTYVFFSLFAITLVTNAQDKPKEPVKQDTKETVKQDTSKRNAVTEEIEVVRSYKPVLADAVKIRRSPNLNDIKPFNPKVSYNLLDKRLELNSGIRELEAQKLQAKIEAQPKNNFAKLGLGNLGTNLAQVNIATGQDPALQAGFNFNHLGMSGKENQQKISKQSLSGYGRSIGDALVLEGKLGYDRTGTYFYGTDPLNTFINLDPQKQRFNYFNAEGLLFNRTDADDENSFSYAAKVQGYIFNNAFKAKENGVVLSGGLGKNLNKFHLGANAAVDITTSKDSAYTFNNNLFKLNPYIQIQTDLFRFTGGINYVNEFGANQRIHIFPAISLDFMLIKNYLTIFGNFGGDVEKNTLKGLSDLNPYLNQNVNLKNTVNKFDIAGGIRGTFAPNVGYKATISYKDISDLTYFTNSISEKQKFDVDYFVGNTNVLGFSGEVNISFSEAFNLDSKVDIRQFDNNNEDFIWLRPGFTLQSTASFKIVDKVKLSGDLLFQGETKAKVYDAVNVLPVPINPAFTAKTIKAFADISVGADYQYNKQISAFFRVNNILGNDYERLPYYRNYGINILGGVSYGF